MAGGQTYGKAVDIWAAGLIMYEMIAGKHALWRKGMDKNVYKK
jgi:serine/threonine protein kinase